jgi:protein ImuB
LRPARRFLCLYPPFWRTERFLRRHPGFCAGAPEAPFVLFEKARSALRLAALDARAERLGLHAGQPLAEARAIAPELLAAPADAGGEAKDFRALAEWLTRFSPHVGIERGAFILDATGLAHLFGGEEAFLDQAVAALEKFGFTAQGAIAESAGAAWGLARFGRERIVETGRAREALEPLPVEALRISPEAARTLRRFGLKTVGALAGLPRAPVTARMGAEVLARLAEAAGEASAPVNPVLPAPRFRAEAPLAEPIVSAEAVMACLERMTREIAAALERAGRGGRRFALYLYRVDGALRRVAVGTARAERTPAVILRLFKDRLADIHDAREAGFGFDLLRLAVESDAPFEAAPAAAFDDAAAVDAAVAAVAADALADRLGNRMGGRVARLALQNRHLPERSAAFVPVSAAAGDAGAPDAAARPVKLLPRPEAIAAVAEIPDAPPSRFFWRRVSYRVARAAGPERILPDWREAPAPARDYYDVEDGDGRRFWIFREGLYGEGQAPKWFLHGFFG